MRNLLLCMEGLYLCDRRILSPEDLKKVDEADNDRNLSACLKSRFSCQLDRIGTEHIDQVRKAQYASKFLRCVDGGQPYDRQCEVSGLSPNDRTVVARIEAVRNVLACAAGRADCKPGAENSEAPPAPPNAGPEADKAASKQAEELAAARAQTETLKRQLTDANSAQQEARRDAATRDQSVERQLADVRRQLDAAKQGAQRAADAERQADEKASAWEVALGREREKADKLGRDLAAANKERDAANSRADELAQNERKAMKEATASQEALDRERDGAETLKGALAEIQKKLEQARADRDLLAASLKEAQSSTARIAEDLRGERTKREASDRDLAEAHAEVEKLKADAAAVNSGRTTEAEAAIARERARADAVARQLDSVRARLADAVNAEKQAREAAAASQTALSREGEKERALDSELSFLRQQYATAYRTGQPPPDEPKPEAMTEWPPVDGKQAAESRAAQVTYAAVETPLLARARLLLKRGDIGAARSILQRAMEEGSAEAAFTLGETYDEKKLSEWNVLGTQADPQKARDLYRRAYDAGYEQAKQRVETVDPKANPGPQ